MASEHLASRGIRPVVIDGSKVPGRKFLVAGNGGLNLAHVGSVDDLLDHYGSSADALRPCLSGFDAVTLRSWADGLGAKTFVGTSGRIFPEALKAAKLLRAWLMRLDGLGVSLKLRTRLVGMTGDGGFRLEGPDGSTLVRPDAAVLALGGASWPRLGSDGAWTPMLAALGVGIRPFQAANCGMLVPWSRVAAERLAGLPLKNLRGTAGCRTARGELVLTSYGVEGQLVYALGPPLREELAKRGYACLQLDLKPDLLRDQVVERLAKRQGRRSWSTWLTKVLRLPPGTAVLMREVGVDAASSTDEVADAVKALPIRVVGTRPIAEAISSAGGVCLDELDDRLMLKRLPGVFVAGEMLDWEAPTGGYLLQACFSTGVAAASGVLAWLGEATQA